MKLTLILSLALIFYSISLICNNFLKFGINCNQILARFKFDERSKNMRVQGVHTHTHYRYCFKLNKTSPIHLTFE